MKHTYQIEIHRLQLWHEKAQRQRAGFIAAFAIIGLTIFGAIAAAFNGLFPGF